MKLLPLLPFFFLAVASWFVIQGFALAVKPSLGIPKRKRGPAGTPPARSDLIGARISGAVLAAAGIALLAFSRISVGLAPRAPVRVEGTVPEGLGGEIERYAASNHIPALSVAIVEGDAVSLVSWGWEDGAGKAPAGPDTRYEIGSLSKAFTGLLLADAAEEGLLSEDDALSSLLPAEVSAGRPFLAEVRLRDLTTHTAGFPRMPPSLGVSLRSLGGTYFGANPYDGLDGDSILSILSSMRPPETIGKDWSYSNFGAGVLGLVIGRARGSGYESALAERIAVPLGMRDTRVRLEGGERKMLVRGYRGYVRIGGVFLGARSEPWDMDDGMAGAGGIRSTARDMSKLLRACASGSWKPAERSMRPLFEVSGTRRMGMGWIMDGAPGGARTIVWHNGQTGGFNSYLAFDPAAGKGVFVIANCVVSVQPLGKDLLAKMLER